ncbi:MAG: hypothetical protein SangKO_098710 [Sandaracinaceae bacterium]
MSAAHLHLILNHAPLFGILFGSLGLVWAFARRDDPIGRGALALLVLAGALALPVYLTGEEAEDLVEGQVGVSEAALDAHEDAALGAAIATGVLGGIALVLLVGFRTRALPRALTGSVLVLAVAAGGWIGYVANLGGKINHPEIRDSRAVPADIRSPVEHYDD